MDLPAHYGELLDGDGVESWPLHAYLPTRSGYLAADDAVRRLEQAPGLTVQRIERIAEPEFAPSPHWEIEVELKMPREDEPWVVRVFIAPSEPLDDEHVDWDGFSTAEREESLRSRWEVCVAGVFGERAADDYHVLLRVLTALAPDMVAVFDSASFRVHSGAWALDAARSEVPPSFEALFSVHTVHPEAPEEGPLWWVHTHGLVRYGCVEVEALEVPEEQVATISDFVTQVAAQFLDLGVPEPDEPFAVGERLELVWLPWEQAISRLPERALGSSADRDEVHAVPSGVLLVPAQGVRRRRYLGLSSCVPTLERNPIYFVSDGEADRASRLAKEKLPLFVELHRRFRGQPQWGFTVKLAFDSGSDELGEPTHEHLWFDVQEIRGLELTAALINQPFMVRGLQEGQIRRHSLKHLTDWTIYSPHGTFTPDRVYHLQRLVNRNEPASESGRG